MWLRKGRSCKKLLLQMVFDGNRLLNGKMCVCVRLELNYIHYYLVRGEVAFGCIGRKPGQNKKIDLRDETGFMDALGAVPEVVFGESGKRDPPYEKSWRGGGGDAVEEI